jgi:GDPmannose 4,6-dehydratase
MTEVAQDSIVLKEGCPRKTALIAGITGQDGAYLAELLLANGYQVHGLKRWASSFTADRIDHLYGDPHEQDRRLVLHNGDMTGTTNRLWVVQEVRPDKIYNLAAQSHLGVSFETAEYTANADGLGTLRLLEAICILKLDDRTRLYQASTSELYSLSPQPQSESTSFQPQSPHSSANLYAFWITQNDRTGYSLFACNGILFNHESRVRGETFVTRTIIHAMAAIDLGLLTPRKLLDTSRLAKLGWQLASSLREGLGQTLRWFLDHVSTASMEQAA